MRGLRRGFHTISHATTLYRRDLVDRGLRYTWSGPGEDWSFLSDAGNLTRLAVLPDVLYDYRLSPSSSAWAGALQSMQGLEFARHRERARSAGAPPPTEEEFMTVRSGKTALLANDRLRAVSAGLYRQSIVDGIEGRTARAFVRSCAAASLDPVKTAGWVLKKLAVARR